MDRSQPRRSQRADDSAGHAGSFGPGFPLPVAAIRPLLVGLSLYAIPGCAPPPVKSVDNPDPSGKIPAIKEAAEHHDRRAVPPLIRDLDDNDPAVRFFAIQGLQRITGETFGYRYYDDEAQRQPAIRRWQQWWAGQHK